MQASRLPIEKRDPKITNREEHVAALRQLLSALTNFLASGWKSEGSADLDPHAGMDPDELECESVEPGGAIHNAVCSVQQFYGGQLPAPEARNPWLLLKRTCKKQRDRFKRQIKAHHYAGKLRDWVEVEIRRLEDKLLNQVGRPPAYSNFDRDMLIYESRRAGKTWKEIARLLNEHSEWESLTEGGIRNAATIFADRCRLPRLARGKSGRPTTVE